MCFVKAIPVNTEIRWTEPVLLGTNLVPAACWKYQIIFVKRSSVLFKSIFSYCIDLEKNFIDI